MDFIHNPGQSKKTIAAIATAPGEGAIAVIRLSGSQALEIAEKCFTGSVRTIPSHTARYGKIVDGQGHPIDAVLLLVMRAPRSYTGEETVEIHCHGGSWISSKVLARLIEAGATPAQPGEFSLRAFLNGKLDLSQAEAVQQLIAANSDFALAAASRQLEGRLSQLIRTFQKELTHLTAIVEAWVDFPEEDLEFTPFATLLAQLDQIATRMEQLRATFYEGRIVREGLSLCLIGAPNVGKSSLLNALLGTERAIVSAIAGTTRDLLQEPARLAGLPFQLIDTAGIRTTEEVIEQEGIRRSRKAMADADLILLLLDASRPLHSDERELLESVPPEKTILVWNKIDLATPTETIDWPRQVRLSAQTREGLGDLHETIQAQIWHRGPPSHAELYITQERHTHALTAAIAACRLAIAHLNENSSPEFIALDLREALFQLGSILGTNVTEDILDAIFSQFCVGK